MALDPVVVRPADARVDQAVVRLSIYCRLGMDERRRGDRATAGRRATGAMGGLAGQRQAGEREPARNLHGDPADFAVSGARLGGSAASRNQGELGTLAILIAAERHRRKTGRWPESIEAIDRGILAKAPVDPYSGQPFRIEHRDGQLVIYSIGPNRKDEHGEFAPKQWLKVGPDDVGARAWDLNLRRRPAAPMD